MTDETIDQRARRMLGKIPSATMAEFLQRAAGSPRDRVAEATALLREAADHIDGLTGASARPASDSGCLWRRIQAFLDTRILPDETHGDMS